MKKIALTVAVLALGLAACGGKSGENTETRPASGHGGGEKGTTDNV